jgi:anti-sigma B factor antagonist
MASAFRIEVTGNHRHLTLRLVGEVDMATAPELRAALGSAFEHGTSMLTVDLEGVEYLDSSGIRELVRAHFNATNLGTHLAFTGANPTVTRALEVAGLAPIMLRSRR